MKNIENIDLAQWSLERQLKDTWMHVERLNEFIKLHPKLVIPIARREIQWPGFISRKRAFQKENKKLMERIELGNDYVLTGEFQPDSPSTHGAYLVHWWGTHKQKQWGLPKLTRRNSKKWFDQAWRCMRSEGKKLEQIPYYAQLGQSAATPAAARVEIKGKIYRRFAQVIRHK
jgi:hypothetical protein